MPGPIPETEIEISYVRSSGPGGQNVNKTSTKAQLRWNVFASQTLTEDEKRILAEKLAHRITNDGDIVISASDQRSQSQNKERVIEELQDLVHEALTPDTPRIPTRPPRSAKAARLQQKKKRGTLKQLRKPVAED